MLTPWLKQNSETGEYCDEYGRVFVCHEIEDYFDIKSDEIQLEITFPSREDKRGEDVWIFYTFFDVKERDYVLLEPDERGEICWSALPPAMTNFLLKIGFPAHLMINVFWVKCYYRE